MTTYNTGNALGSSDARDLYDNAENIDNFANGSANTYQDRLGVTRKSLAGMNNAFDDFIESSGYTVPVAYTSGIVLTEYNQLIEYNDEFYKLKAGQAPYTTTGTWGTDSAKLVAVGDAALRQELADDGGSSLVGYLPAGTGAAATDVQTKLREFVSVSDFGASPSASASQNVTSINAALAYANSIGGAVVDFDSGRYEINGTLIIWSNTIMRGKGLATEIYLADGSNCDMIKTEGFSGHYGQNHYRVDVHGIPYGYGFENLLLNGNSANNTSGMGIVGYGVLHHIYGVRIINTAQRGWWHMMGNNTFVATYKDLPEAKLSLELYNCGTVGAGDHGGVFAGPHDSHYDRIIAVNCGLNSSQFGVYFYGDSLVTGGGRISGIVHTYGGAGSGVLVSGSEAAVQGPGLVICETGIKIETAGCNINVQPGSANLGKAIWLVAGSNTIDVRRMRINVASHDGIVVESSNNVIRGGNVFPASNFAGSIIVNSSNNNQYLGFHLGATTSVAGSKGIEHTAGTQCVYDSIYITGVEESMSYASAANSNNRINITSNNATDTKHLVGTLDKTDDVRVRKVGSALWSIPAANVRNYTGTGNVGTGSDTLINDFIRPPSFWRTGVKAKIRAWGYTANNSNTKTVRLEFGSGNTILTKTLTPSVAGEWCIEVDVTSTGANAQTHIATLIESGSAQHVQRGTSTQTTTSNIDVRVRGEGVADNDIVAAGLEIDWYQ